ncbi:sugar ABC transporter ATP-binding protein [Halocella sp. SP3-1]|uniref:sugar ABC transporter ATP-binding protein n=1 Tax=Halocella sp. SP3-1 TaxID=2382161 RepID=UPI000F74E335|nr:sugar ABC transporter ATP-binding protein [Halocella sp. SP3-1]AZO93290.1 sugar ABC transporter ATP-binding protein [Halocella sp. SP3-1]
MSKDILFKVEGVSKSFPGVKALNKVNFELKEGTVHALCGENGAGKSTLMKILMGIYQRDEGKIYYKGESVNFFHPKQALELGISIIEQELNPVPDMTVAENIFLGREPINTNKFINYEKLNNMARKILSKLKVDINPTIKMKKLSLAEVQLVEIAKAFSYDSDVIIMDEPTSALGNEEVETFFEIIEILKKEKKGIIYVSHRMKEIFTISDEVTVLRDGHYIATKKINEIDLDELVRLMISRQLEGQYVKENVPLNNNLLTVENLTKEGKYKNISLKLNQGEILGIFGLTGSGRSEFLNGLFGVEPADSGKIFINDKISKIKKPLSAMKNGLAFITEDRKETGLVLTSSVKENISVSSLKELSGKLFIDKKQEDIGVKEMVDKFRVKTPSVDQIVNNLSGGNQQKVVLGRWLLTNPRILLMDEPTRGIDVGSKREIYEFMSEFANNGGAVIMVSSELPEIMGMSDRIIVFKDGEIAGELNREEANEEKLMSIAS